MNSETMRTYLLEKLNSQKLLLSEFITYLDANQRGLFVSLVKRKKGEATQFELPVMPKWDISEEIWNNFCKECLDRWLEGTSRLLITDIMQRCQIMLAGEFKYVTHRYKNTIRENRTAISDPMVKQYQELYWQIHEMASLLQNPKNSEKYLEYCKSFRKQCTSLIDLLPEEQGKVTANKRVRFSHGLKI